MAISFQKYVDIVSGVGGAAQVALRELIGRLFTINTLLPTKSFIEFTDLLSVGEYFGTDSEEYARALFYFGFVSKQTTNAKKISFARWADADTAPLIFGEAEDFIIATFTAISDGAFSLTLGPDTEIMTGIDFSTDLSLTDIATTIETAVQAANVAVMWTGATVTYNAIDKRFELVGGATGNNVVTVADAGSGTEIAELIGWLNPDTILSDGVVEETITDVLTESSDASNNFGSFIFQPALTDDEILEAATWAKAQNVRFQFFESVLEVDSQTTYDALKDIGATGIMIKDASTPDEYPEMMPMIILAATDYTRRNANQNYMYQQFVISATVTDTSTSNTLDAIRMNYYGETQQAGRSLRFFQRGLLTGLATDPLDMNTFANEQWLKDSAGVAIMNLLLALSAVPANNTGRAQILGVIQGTIDQALFNATISVGKPINDTQKAFIEQVTGDPEAWRQIQDIGYWIDALIVEDTQNPGEFKATYLLIYAKGDVVRKVEGTHTLI